MLIEDYCRALSDLSPEDVEKAADEAMKSERFLPPPRILRDYAASVRKAKMDEKDRRRRLDAPRAAPSNKTLLQKAKESVELGYGFNCAICHDSGFVYCRATDLPEGGDPHDNPNPGMKGLRFPQGMAYFSLRDHGLVTLHCPCHIVPDATNARRVQAHYDELGIEREKVFSYFDKWGEEE